MSAPAPPRLTFLSRVGCHLCDEARVVLVKVAGERGLPITERDVDADPADRAEYGDWVPVLLVDGAWHDHYRIDADRLRRALDAGPSSP